MKRRLLIGALAGGLAGALIGAMISSGATIKTVEGMDDTMQVGTRVRVSTYRTISRLPARGEDIGVKAVARQLCTEYGVPWELVDAIITTESNWTNAVGHNYNGSIDVGLFQLNNKSWPDISRLIKETGWDPYAPMDNLWAGVRYLAYWLKYWREEGYRDTELTSMVISSFAAPTDTKAGDPAWWYVLRVRQTLGWDK